MRAFIICTTFFLLGQCHGGLFLHKPRGEGFQSKFYGPGLQEENNNSPIINVNNYQNVDQQQAATGGHHRIHHSRGDWNYNRGDGYSHHLSMKQESYHHHRPKFGQHHDPNMFGNSKIGPLSLPSSSAAAASSAATSAFGGSSAASSSSSVASSGFGGGSSSSASSSSSSSGSGYREDPYFARPWRY
ncbi:transcriptional regulator ovo [Musca domestica]|uniref:Protein ovo n=1 Tax=Musca domestica TaxID=7370 RepID=A0A1I8NJH9_MUSDO|nr:transcriptional regulator ovo [Musca domestica]